MSKPATVEQQLDEKTDPAEAPDAEAPTKEPEPIPDATPESEAKLTPEAEHLTQQEIIPIQPIPVGRLQLQVEASNTYRINVPQGTEPEQVMDESVWCHIAVRLRPCDEIIVMPEDGAWKLLLHVQSCGRNYAHVIKQVLYDLAPTEQPVHLPSLYKVDWAGTTDQWRVTRDGRELRCGFASEGVARRYAANHEAAVDR